MIMSILGMIKEKAKAAYNEEKTKNAAYREVYKAEKDRLSTIKRNADAKAAARRSVYGSAPTRKRKTRRKKRPRSMFDF